MANRDINLRRRSIVNCLQCGDASFEEIMDYLAMQEEIHDASIVCSKKTLERDRMAVEEELGVEILYDFSKEVYRITDRFEPEMGNRLFETLDLFSVMKKGVEAAGYIFFEHRRPAGTEHMDLMMKAVMERRKVQFTYQKHWEDHSTNRLVSPLALKEAQGRWYLLAQQEGKLKTFGLDRKAVANWLQNQFFDNEPSRLNGLSGNNDGCELAPKSVL